MSGELFFWISMESMFVIIALLLRDIISISLVFSGGFAVITLLLSGNFSTSATVFALSMGVLFISHILTIIVSKRAINENKIKEKLGGGAKYGYVCETVYPDIAGKVIINGKIFAAISEKCIYHGNVVICKKPINGVAEIPIFDRKR